MAYTAAPQILTGTGKPGHLTVDERREALLSCLSSLITSLNTTLSDCNACRFKGDELEMIDNQGRCVITDHGAFVLFNV